MIIASLIARRRALLLCLASVLLHYLVFVGIAPHVAAPAAAASAPVLMTVKLWTAPPQARPAPQQVRPAPERPRPRARTAPAVPAPLAAGTAAPADAASMDAVGAEVAPYGEVVPDGNVAPDEAGVLTASAALPPPSEPAPGPAETAPLSGQQRYKVDLPPSSDMWLDVARTDVDGNVWRGETTMAWKFMDGAYSMTVEAGLKVVFARVNLVLLTSEGRIGADGFVPLMLTEKRRGRTPTATRFDHRDGRITFSSSARVFALLPGTQDKATIALQLAAIARGDPGQLDGQIDILVGDDNDASLYRFVMLGQEEIQTGLGKTQAWRLSRPPRPGAYSSRLDIWLAPEHGWYPVQIRNTEANGAVTTQTASKIIVTELGT